MKYFTVTTVVVLFLSVSTFAQDSSQEPAQQPDGAASGEPSVTSGTIQSIDNDAGVISDSVSSSAAIESYNDVLRNSGVNYQQLKRLESEVRALDPMSGLQGFHPYIRKVASDCVDFVSEANQCCSKPETCGGGGGEKFKNFVKGTSIMAPSLAIISGAGAVANCLASLPGLVDGLSFSSGMSKVCGMLRNGPGGHSEGGQGSSNPGCRQVCGTSSNILSAYRVKITQAMQNGATGLAVVLNDTDKYLNEIKKAGNTCNSGLARKEKKAEAQLAALQQTQSSLIQCATDFINGEENEYEYADEDEDEDEKTPNEVASESSEFNPRDRGSYQKLNADNPFAGVTDGSEMDDIIPDDNDASAANQKNTGAGTPQGMGGIGAGMGGGGRGLAGGGGGAGENPQPNAGGGRPRAKTDSLIGGYAKSKGGSGSSSGSPLKPKKWGSLFKKAKKAKNAKDVGALAALSKLVKAGISPNTADSIFERVTTRFVASTAKENMFDAKNNKKLWMHRK